MLQLTWYHNGEEIVADYCKEFAENGSLVLSSVEVRHGGVYKLVAVNGSGKAEKEVSLCVEKANRYANASQMSNNFTHIPVLEFAAFVSKCRENDNKGFSNQFKV